MWSGEEEQAFRRVLERYQQLHPNVSIKNLGAIRDDTKAIRAIVAGAPPDLFTLSDPLYLGAIAAQGGLEPLDELFAQSGLRKEDFVRGSLSQASFRGKLYAMPFLVDAYALFWNKTLFREAGLDPERPPQTLEELRSAAIRLTKRDASGNLKQLGIAPVSNRSFYAGDIPLVMHLFAGELTAANEPKVTPDSSRNLRAFEWSAGLIEAMGGYTKVNAFAAGFGQPQGGDNPFFKGKLAMMINGQWNPYWAETYAPGLDYGVAPLPYPSDTPERRNATWLGGNFFCIPTGAPNRKEAWKLLAWMQTEEAQVLFADTMHGVPNIRSVLRNKKLRTGEPWRYHYGKFFDLVENGVPGHFPPLPVSALYNNSLLDAYDMVLDGKKPASQALKHVRERVQNELDRYP